MNTIEKIIPIVVIAMLIYGIVLVFTKEGFDNPSTKITPPCPPEYVHCGSGDCRLKTDIYNPCS